LYKSVNSAVSLKVLFVYQVNENINQINMKMIKDNFW